jgi:glutathione S-transferase
MRSTAQQQQLSLLTFPPMIDSETSRFVLRHYNVPYVERPHVFGWGSLLAFCRSFTPQVPLLYGGGLRSTGPRAIVDHYDASCEPNAMLVPTHEPLHTHVEADWELFNGELAAYTAVIAYYYLLPHPDILTEPFFRGVPHYEKVLFGHTYCLQRAILTLLLRLSAGRADDYLRRSRLIFDHVDRRVKDGRRYLAGDRVTLSDIGFAAAAAPLLLPVGYRAPIPALGVMPQVMQDIVAEMRQRPAAGFVTRIYQECMPL